ncbi:hypothetical protein DFO73_11672 [Cytobacillus oceanisediminis]|uniref:DUF340 domain-containing protein n=1 Tax=Cytobacillus oceanisediminis TaxID=665099 RepID=A0A2V2ZLK4_9BACI|nr:hypothetical protein [Cytobacillus oceanisediminis]PWW20257.1 hypothetical protein DFO73_11672 [Cytobacillus oceanisediminis]
MLNTIREVTFVFIIVGIVTLLGNWVGYNILPFEALPGIAALVLICLIGFVIQAALPSKIPVIVYIAILSVVLAIPGMPGSEKFVKWTDQVNPLAITTPVLAYAGIAIGRSWTDFTKLGWKTIVVGMCVLLGTFLGSAIIAEIILRAQGII